MPLFDMMELVLVGRWGLPPSFKLRLITRSLYVGKQSTNLHNLNQNLLLRILASFSTNFVLNFSGSFCNKSVVKFLDPSSGVCET
jgi:hypothetical protein